MSSLNPWRNLNERRGKKKAIEWARREKERKDERIYLGLCRVRNVAIFLIFFRHRRRRLCLHCVPVMFCDALLFNCFKCAWSFWMAAHKKPHHLLAMYWCCCCFCCRISLPIGNFTSLTIYNSLSTQNRLKIIYKCVIVQVSVSAHHSELNHLFPTDFTIIWTQSKSARTNREWEKERKRHRIYFIFLILAGINHCSDVCRTKLYFERGMIYFPLCLWISSFQISLCFYPSFYENIEKYSSSHFNWNIVFFSCIFAIHMLTQQ